MPEHEIAIVILAVSSRIHMAKATAEKTGGKIFLDSAKRGEWGNFILAVEKTKSLPFTHLLLFEDDVQVSDNFIENACEIVSLLPSDIISFFNMKRWEKGNLLAEKQNRHFFSDNGCTTQAILFPKNDLLAWTLFSERYFQFAKMAIDVKLYYWMQMFRRAITIVTPNIVEHLCPNSSTYSKALSNRESAKFASSPKINWKENIDLFLNQSKPEFKSHLHNEWNSKIYSQFQK